MLCSRARFNVTQMFSFVCTLPLLLLLLLLLRVAIVKRAVWEIIFKSIVKIRISGYIVGVIQSLVRADDYSLVYRPVQTLVLRGALTRGQRSCVPAKDRFNYPVSAETL